VTGVLHRVGDLFIGAAAELRVKLVVEQRVVAQVPREAGDRVVTSRGGDFGRPAHFANLTGVLAEPRHPRLDQRRSLARTGRLDCLAHDPVDLQRV
jgi:hypothetical protein